MGQSAKQLQRERVRQHVQAWADGVRHERFEPTRAGYESYREDHPDAPSIEQVYLSDPRLSSWNKVRTAFGLSKGGGRHGHGDLRQARKSMERFCAEVGPGATQDQYWEWSKDKPEVMSSAQLRRLFGHGWWRLSTELVPAMHMSRARRAEAGPELERQVRSICRGRRLTQEQYEAKRRDNYPGHTSARTIGDKYGGWDAALDAAGLK